MNTVLTQLLQYFDIIYIDHKKENNNNNNNNSQKEQKDPENDININNNNEKLFNFKRNENNRINIEFALWIVSIFVNILTSCNNNDENNLYKMLILIFNDTLMSLLFDCIVIAPASIGYKVALMVSEIIEMYPKQNPFQNLKKDLFETAKLCNDLCSDKIKYEKNNNNNNNNNNSQKEQKDPENDININNNNEKLFNFKRNENNRINIEFALWIVSIFVNILTSCNNNDENNLYKMLILIFNDTLMSLLFDCIVIAPASIGYKVALMVSEIIEMYPKQNPFQNLKKKTLYITVKHVTVISNVLQDLHQNNEIATDLIIGLTKLMLSITSCNYHHEYSIDLNSMGSWFESVYSTYSALKWFSIKNKNNRNSETLQFLSPNFYSKLYENISSWQQIKENNNNKKKK
eukprot:511189_1